MPCSIISVTQAQEKRKLFRATSFQMSTLSLRLTRNIEYVQQRDKLSEYTE